MYPSHPFSRWLRLLFGREFAMLDLLLLWDAIFAIDNHFELTRYIVVAMLISIREESEFPMRRYLFQDYFIFISFHEQCSIAIIPPAYRI